jgi:opacity protein-like surface antigen
MKWKLFVVGFCLCFTALNFNLDVLADENENGTIIQCILAQMNLEEDDTDVQDDTYELPFIGVAVQKPFNKKRLVYGLESGALLSFDNETRHINASGGSSGGSATVVIDNEMFLLDYFLGGYLSIEIARRLRLYAGAGPLIVYGSREIKPENEDDVTIQPVTESGIGFGAYARAGLELKIVDYFMIGAGLRTMTSGLEFEDEVGKNKIEGTQYYISISFKM